MVRDLLGGLLGFLILAACLYWVLVIIDRIFDWLMYPVDRFDQWLDRQFDKLRKRR